MAAAKPEKSVLQSYFFSDFNKKMFFCTDLKLNFKSVRI